MKKITLLAAAAIIAISFTSCKKDYTCTCKDKTSPPDVDIVIKYTKVKKKDAQSSCDAANNTYAIIDYGCTLN